MLRILIASIVFVLGIFLDIWLEEKTVSQQIYMGQLERIRTCDKNVKRVYIGSSGTHYLFENTDRYDVDVYSAPGVLGVFLLNDFLNSECYRAAREKPPVIFFLSPDLFVGASQNYTMSSLYKTLDLNLAIKYLALPNPFIGYRKMAKQLSCFFAKCTQGNRYPKQGEALSEAQSLERWKEIALKELDYVYLNPILSSLQKKCDGRCLVIFAPVYEKYYEKIDTNRVSSNINYNYRSLEFIDYYEALTPEMIGDTLEHIAPHYALHVSERLDQFLKGMLDED